MVVWGLRVDVMVVLLMVIGVVVLRGVLGILRFVFLFSWDKFILVFFMLFKVINIVVIYMYRLGCMNEVLFFFIVIYFWIIKI